MHRAGAVLLAALLAPPLNAQEPVSPTDEQLVGAAAVLHVDAQTGRLAGVSRSGPVAEVGAKILDVLFGDYATGEWIAYLKRVEGDYVKPAVSQRLLLIKSDGSVAIDEDYSPAGREALAARLSEFRRRAELLTGDRHVPDYLLRSTSNALLHVEIQRSVPFDRGRGNLSATHTATVRGIVQGEFEPGQTIEFVEESRRTKRYEMPASRERIVLLTHSRSVTDGQMKWWVHERVNYGYTGAGLAALKADLARVRAAQAGK